MKITFVLSALIFCAARFAALAQTPTPTEASTKSDAVLFQDDFSNPASGWVVRKTDYGEFAYLDGEFRVLLNKPDFNTYSILPERRFNDVSVEVDARLASGPSTGVYGIICRAEAKEGTASKAYVFAIRADGLYAILKRTSATFWDAIASGKKPGAIKSGTNRLRADCSGSHLTFYINGEKLLEATDRDFKTGQAGMAVTTQPKSAAMDVRFDNLVVRSLTP